MKNAYERKGEKTTSLEAHSFWQRVKGKLPRYYFSLSWHEAEAGKGRGAVRCVRQQVRLGLPCQEVGRACGSYLIDGRPGAQHPTLTFSEQQRGIKKPTLKARTLRLPLPLLPRLFVQPLPLNVCMCLSICRWIHTHIHPLPHSTAAKGEVTGAAKSIQSVSEKVSNEENAVSPWTLTAVPSLPETRLHMAKTNIAAQTCKLTPHTWESEREISMEM